MSRETFTRGYPALLLLLYLRKSKKPETNRGDLIAPPIFDFSLTVGLYN
jgi:hypothetical protein